MHPQLAPIGDELSTGATDPTRDYVLEIAIPHDALELHRLFFAAPLPGGRRRLLGEVRRLIDEESMWLARERRSGHVVGVCSIEGPRPASGELDGPATLDGPSVHPDHRGRGLAVALASMAIAHHFWDVRPAPLYAHVPHDEGASPTLPEHLGFGAEGSPDGPPPDWAPLDATAFVLEDEGRACAFWRVATYLDRGVLTGADGQSSPVYVETHPEMSPHTLRSAAASILLGNDDSADAA